MSELIKTNIDEMRMNFRHIKGKMNLLEKETCKLHEENLDLKKEVMFYKSLFITHRNSAVFNLHVKTIHGQNFWVDPIRDSREYLITLDDDDEVRRWLEPVKCER